MPNWIQLPELILQTMYIVVWSGGFSPPWYKYTASHDEALEMYHYWVELSGIQPQQEDEEEEDEIDPYDDDHSPQFIEILAVTSSTVSTIASIGDT